MGSPSASIGWEERRDSMKDVCSTCHTEDYINAFYMQYDGMIELYEDKFAKPGLALMKLGKPLLKPAKSSNKLDWIWFELWHHEGRRMRMGASRMAPDITHWHGIYEVAKHYYNKFLPELEKLVKNGKKGNAKQLKAAKKLEAQIKKMLNSDNHKWYINKMSAKQKSIRKSAVEDAKKMYAK